MKAFKLLTILSDGTIFEQDFHCGGVVKAMNLHRRWAGDLSVTEFRITPITD